MKCNKCGKEMPDESIFCSDCGSSLNKETKNNNRFNLKSLKSNKKSMIIGGISILILIIIIFSFAILNDPSKSFLRALSNNKYTVAMKIYDEKIKGNVKEERKVETELMSSIQETVKKFKENKMEYSIAYNRIELIEKTGLLRSEVTKAKSEIDQLNNSRIAFKKGNEFLNADNYIEAIREFKKVVKEDENYSKAEEKINSLIANYKQDIIKKAEAKAISHEYDKAIFLLKEAASVIKNDSDIETMLSLYQVKLIEQLKSQQQVIVERTRILVQDTEYKSLYPDMIEVIIKNNSGKTIKNMQVGCLGYDKNGYPMKIKTQFDFSEGNYEFVGNAENANVVNGAKFGQNKGWCLDEVHGIYKVLACVKEVTFYDGTTWDNPYYEYWIEQYKEKPIN